VQGTALAQEEQLHQAVRAMGRTSETLEQTTARLTLEVASYTTSPSARIHFYLEAAYTNS
jgi:hypothetical protein